MKKSRGFTLVELMIVIAVIAILATLALTGFRTAQASARDTQRQQNVKGVQVALECYYSENGMYLATADLDWADLATSFSACWTGGSLDDKPAGDTVAASGGDGISEITRTGGGSAGTYGYDAGDDQDTYEIILTGETKTLTFNSPQ